MGDRGTRKITAGGATQLLMLYDTRGLRGQARRQPWLIKQQQRKRTSPFPYLTTLRQHGPVTTIDDDGKVTGITDALVESAAYPVAFTDKAAEVHHNWLAIVSAARAPVQ